MMEGPITPTDGQEFQLERLVMSAVKKSREITPLDKEGAQRLIGNGGKFQEGVNLLIANLSSADKRFELINTFELTAPQTYDHSTQLATFAKLVGDKSERFYHYPEFSDKNYERVTDQLVPGKVYGIKIFKIKARVTSEDCLAFLALQRAKLVGAQGLSLVRQLKKEQFPADVAIISFDVKEALWTDLVGGHGVPRLIRFSAGDWEFEPGDYERCWNKGSCIICFCDLATDKQ